MSLDKSEIQKIAWLARLAINKDDIPSYCDELTDILDLMKGMNSVDTTNITPLAHPLEVFSRLRTDNITEVNQREHFQTDQSKTKNGYYIVPKVIE